MKRLEAVLQRDPYDDQAAGELYRELQEVTGYSQHEATAHVEYLRIMAHRARVLARAAELLRDDSPTRPFMLRVILAMVNMAEASNAAFHITTTAGGPSVEDKPREVAGREHVVVIRVPAEWLIAQHDEQVRRVPPLRRPKGDT